ncbi:hypothetical protein AVEN_112817-1 [Araneus ventricosus]|uniref:Uncharacterized protein n=1 Tax=Araneus ventricosus TaxID=182803 RepID=A0A4Y2R0B8_ARAVE|nr:hypothetical protein AVEN_112817-1 [Araneus ventricosus]
MLLHESQHESVCVCQYKQFTTGANFCSYVEVCGRVEFRLDTQACVRFGHPASFEKSTAREARVLNAFFVDGHRVVAWVECHHKSSHLVVSQRSHLR